MAEEETDEEYLDRRDAQYERLLSYEPTTIAEYAHQPDHGFWGDREFERKFQEEHSKRAANYLIRYPKVAGQLRKGVVRCPTRGCFLADVFLFPLEPSGERTLAITNLTRGESRSSWVNWAYSDRWHVAPVYLPASCRHGSVRLPLDWFEEIVATVEGWKHALHTHEEVYARLPEELRRGKASRTFHPPAALWRPK